MQRRSRELDGLRLRALRALADLEGNEIALTPGNTWIELVPADDGSVELVP